MNFFKFVFFNVLLLSSQVYCDQPKLSCIDEGDTDIYVRGFSARFFLCTSKRNENLIITDKGEKLKTFLTNEGFKDNVATVVLIHGFLNNHRARWVVELTGNLTNKQKVNVIQVDWSDAFFNKHIEVDVKHGIIGNIREIAEDFEEKVREDLDSFFYDDSEEDDEDDEDDIPADDTFIPEELNPLDYQLAALRTEQVALQLYNFLVKIAKTRPNRKKFLASLHLVGHSLGAHVAGQTGRLLQKRSKVKVKRVTGLDPAYPCFHPKSNPQLKLDVNDAHFVDVIHTNGEPEVNDNFGTYEALGHVDFYPHRGYNQPNCNLNSPRGFVKSVEDFIDDSLYDVVDFLTQTILRVNATTVVLNYGNDEIFDIICDHGEAPNYFVQSLSRDIYAVPTTTPISNDMIANLTNQLRTCAITKNCVKMGYHIIANATKPGKYYADTTI